MRKFRRWLGILAVLGVLGACLTACYGSTTTASCAFVVGDGTHDSNVKKIVYPGQQMPTDTNVVVRYVPCNSRNYITNRGDVQNANGAQVGDQKKPTIAYTSTGVKIEVESTAYWTLNQSDKAMRDFWTVCFKYTCASEKDQGGDANFSTDGWNGWLGENMGPAVNASIQAAANTMGDDIWRKHDQASKDKLATLASEKFADIMRRKTGFAEDIMCGSGDSSGWSNPDDPGKGEFKCGKVRFEINNDVTRAQVDPGSDSEGASIINKKRLDDAKAMYGDDAGFWLALQDSIEKCKDAQVTCVFNLGGPSGSPSVPVPTKK